jgi:2'-5' RNA ligase
MAFSKALYFIALVPPLKIREEVKELKIEIERKYMALHAQKLPAHITVIPPVWLENQQENPFLDLVFTIAEESNPFKIHLLNFHRFGQKIIYIKIKDHEPIKKLQERLQYALGKIIPVNDSTKFHPHITLATKDLSHQHFKTAWQEFKERSFEASFNADSLIVFKHNGKTWDVFKTFPFLREQ